MPRKNLYVTKDDEPIFDEAAEVLGEESLSAAIASVLRRAVEAKKAELEGMEQIELEVGTRSGVMSDTPDLKKIRFTGKELAFHRKLQGNDTRGVDTTLYRTKKGKFLLFVEDWSRWQGEATTSEYFIYDTLEDVETSGNATGQLIRDAKEALGDDPATELDI